MSWKDPILNHIDRDYTEPIRDTLWNNIHLSQQLKDVTSQKVFQRLGRIRQLGPAFHVYPGATHTRLAHSFGVLHIAKSYIRKLISDPDCPRLSLEGVKAFLCASLLHDLGHFPYTHSLKELPLTDHEQLSGKIILEDPLSSIIKNRVAVSPYTVASIVDTELDPQGNNEVIFFRKILSGVLDPDKLDYLNRDAYFCGIPYGAQDIDFIISKIAPHKQSAVALNEQGVSAVENLLFSKYLMYKTVYWHKTVRIATAMIKKAVLLSLNDRSITSGQLYGIDDDQFVQLFTAIDSDAADLVRRVTHRDLFKVVWEEDFDDENKHHKFLTDLENRTGYEKECAERLNSLTGSDLKETDVIVDVPEPISFEVDLPIIMHSGTVSFTQSGSVFTPPVVRGFTRNLRKIRYILPADRVTLMTGDIVREVFL